MESETLKYMIRNERRAISGDARLGDANARTQSYGEF
jgi:hypothetical protein